MLFTEPENQINYKTYPVNTTTKQRKFNLNTDVLENMNELIKVFNKKNQGFYLNSSILANIIFESYFNIIKNYPDGEILETLKHEVLKQNK